MPAVRGANIPADIARDVRARLVADGDTGVRLIAHREGGVSDVFIIRTTPSGREVALKVARAGEAGLSEQAELLMAAGGHAIPRVLGVFGDGRAYLMEYLEGRQLWAACATPRVHARKLALRVFEARAEYEERTGRPFGDFHPANVVVTRAGAVQLMDPKPAEPSTRGLIDDLAHWTYKTSWSAVGWGVPHPVRAANLARVNVALLDAATDGLPACQRGEFLAGVFAGAEAELGLLGASPWARDRVSVAPARVLLRTIRRMTTRP